MSGVGLRLFGGIPLLVLRSLRQHAVSSVITMITAALATGLVMAVFAISQQTEDAFTGGEVGDEGRLAVLGGRGSQLQLVLNAVFHLETSPGNIPWSLYKDAQEDPRVALAVPYALGDNYHGFRIVGTTLERFTQMEVRPGRKFELIDKNHRWFDPARMEAVVGSYVAEKTGLRVGSTFNPYHGLNFDPATRHEEVYRVVGITQPTNTPSDRVIWVPIEGIFRMSGHVLRGAGEEFSATAGEEIPDEHKEVSAVLLTLRSPQDGISFDITVNRQGTAATLAWPVGRVMAELFDKLGWVSLVLELVAYLVVVVAAAAILAAIYNTIHERRRDFAILRALGARRSTIFAAIVCESGVIAGIGALLGFVVYAGILLAAAYVVRAQTGVVLDPFTYHPILRDAPLYFTLLGVAAGVVPAIKAYATDVATNLSPIS